MATYTLDTHATVKQLEDAGMDPRQAEAVVAAISRSDAELATKADLKVGIAGVRADIDKLEAGIWKIGATIAGLALLINKFLDWIIRQVAAIPFPALTVSSSTTP